MPKQRNLHFPLRSIVLCVLLVFTCLIAAATVSAADGAAFESDDAAVAAGYVFRTDGAYYKTLAEAYAAVPDNGTIEMLADYMHTGGCMEIGAGASAVKTYTVKGNGHTYITAVNHAIHFQNSKVTVDGMNYRMTGIGAGVRIDETSSLTLKNAIWLKTTKSGGFWQPSVIVYGSLILDEGSAIKNSNADSTKDSHAVYTEKKTVTPAVTLKGNATIEAKAGNCFFERNAADIRIESCNITLSSESGAIRGGDETAKSTVSMIGPTAADLEDAALTEKWRALYTIFGVEWAAGDVAQIGSIRYSTLTAALGAVTNGGTIQLLTNVELTGTVRYVPDAAIRFTLDGAGFTVSGGNFTLLSFGENVTCTMQNITLLNKNGGATGTLDLAGADVTLHSGTIIRNAGGTANGNSNYVGISISKSGGKLTINKNALVDVAGTALKSDGFSSDITINGGIVKTAYRGYVTNNAAVTLTILDGSFTTTCTDVSQSLIYCWSSTGNFRMTGGTVGTAGANLIDKGSGKLSASVTGGTLVVGSESYTVHQLHGYSLSLNDDIGINFYAAIADSTVTVTITLPNGTQQVLTLTDANQVVEKFGLLKLYRFSCGVSAAEMGDSVSVALKVSDNIDSAEVSALSYARAILADEKQSAEVKTLVTAMLHYGAAAQQIFNRNTEHLVNEDLTAPDWSAVAADETWKAELSGSVEGLTYYGTSLLLKSKTIVRHWFLMDAGKTVSDYTFRMNGEIVTATAYDDTYCYVDIAGIRSSELSRAFTITVGELTITGSAMSYCHAVLTAGDADQTLLAAVRSLVLYSRAADTYFAD